MKTLAIAALLPLLAVAAGPVPNATVGLGQSARVAGLRVTPLAVVEDSRCPMNARCIWAGRIVVSVRIARGRRVVTRQMVLGEPAGTPLGGLVLDSATPERMAGSSGPRPPYRFHFSPLAPD